MSMGAGLGRTASLVHGRTALAVLVLVMAVSAVFSPAPASASGTAWWRLSASTAPAVVRPGKTATIVLRAENLGDVAIAGTATPVTITDEVPSGMEVISAHGQAGETLSEGIRGPVECEPAQTVTCTWRGPEPLEPYEQIDIYISVKAASTPSQSDDTATVAGGQIFNCNKGPEGNFKGPFCETVEESGGHYEAALGGPVQAASVVHSITVADETTPYGLADYSLTPETSSGELDSQAGSHPFQLTTTLGFNESESLNDPPGFTKETRINLPPGLVGNAQSILECTDTQFSETPLGDNASECPNESAVGVASVTAVLRQPSLGLIRIAEAIPVFNLVPGSGEPARFGFEIQKTPITIDTSVRTGTDYGVVASSSNLSELANVTTANITLWGAPGDPGHGLSRGWSCVQGGFAFQESSPGSLSRCTGSGEEHPHPFLRLPTSCAGPLPTSIEVASWQQPTVHPVRTPGEFGHQMESLQGCEKLPFEPTFSLEPDTTTTSTPTGLTVKITQPQEANENAAGLGSSDIKSTSVTLPEGFTLNPSSANGLEACSEEQIGFLGTSGEEQIFTPTFGEPPSSSCPSGSKVATARIKTPLIANPLIGGVYLATQEENPFSSLVAVYLVAEDPVSKVLVKLPGKITLNEVTGRATATFENTPQAPIQELELHFFDGPLAALSTPPRCGTYTTEGSIAPWSGTAPVPVSSQATIGGSCPSQVPFAPTLTAGTSDNAGGAFSPLLTTLSRGDQSQSIQALSIHLPPGLTALISSVKLCEEAQANAGSCGAESLIGDANVSAGIGSEPYTVSGGQVFLTGPYNGAPFGLSIVTPAKAGPFNLGNVVVRAALQIDPHTADVTVTTGTIPHILRGIPLQIKTINVAIDRPHFAINPTNCASLSFTGTVQSVEGATAPISEPFTAVNCAKLKFTPKFTASLSGHATKKYGAGIITKLTFPSTAFGTQANIAKVKVVLPIQLPTRQSTLEKACLAKVFEANPAGCPKGSIVGQGIAHTPLLAVPLRGPAYLVSHGNEAFPALTVVLQGDNVTYELVGTTLIRKGITSTSFKTVADVPVSSFELKLPTGAFSALTSFLPPKAKGDFCGRKLVMPTSFVAQNGVELHQNTPLALTGCHKTKPVKKHAKHK